MRKWAIDRNQFSHKEYLSGSLSTNEGEHLSRLVAENKPEIIVEVGGWIGCSAVYLAQAAKEYDGHLFSIDPHEASKIKKKRRIEDMEPVFRENMRIFGVEDHVTVIRKTSMEALEDWHLPVYFFLLDSLKFEANVRRDFYGWIPWIPLGGIFVFHDYTSHKGVQKVVDGLLRPSGNWEEMETVQSLAIFRRRR